MNSWPDYFLGVVTPIGLVGVGYLVLYLIDFVDFHLIRRCTQYLNDATDQPLFKNAGVQNYYHGFAWAFAYTRKRPRRVFVVGWKWRRRTSSTTDL